MSLWTAVLLACGLSLLTKLAGHLVPASWLAHPTAQRVLGLLPVALLAALVAVQAGSTGTASGSPALALDARAAAVGVAGVALLLRAPFLLVILLAAGAAAGLRAVGWAA